MIRKDNKTMHLYLLSIYVCLFSVHSVAQTNARVLPDDHQAIEAWGAFPSYNRTDWGAAWHIFNRPWAESALYDSLNMNSIRLDLQPRYNDGATGVNSTQMQDFKNALLQWTSRGHTDWFMSVWSPPAQFKDPADINGWSNSLNTVTHLRQDKEADYIQFIINALAWIRGQNLPLPQAFSLQNEPTYGPGYDGCVYTPEQYQRVNVALRKSLDSAGMQAIQLIGGEGNYYWDSYSITGGFADTAFARATEIVASHTYDVWSTSNADYWQESEKMKTYGKPYWMTEYCPLSTGNGIVGDTSTTEIDWTLGGTRRILRELRHSHVSRYYFWMAYGLGQSKAGWENLMWGDTQVHWIRMGRVFQAILKYAPAGSSVRYLTTPDADLKAGENNWIDMLGFVSTQAMTVVIVNPTAFDKSITVNGLLGTSLNVIRPTNADDNMNIGSQVISNGKATVSLPAKSVTLLVTNVGSAGTTTRLSASSPATPLDYSNQGKIIFDSKSGLLYAVTPSGKRFLLQGN